VNVVDSQKGLVINPGIVLGKAYIWNPSDEPAPAFDLLINQKEILSKALIRSTSELENAIASSNAMYSEAVSIIFEAHKLMASDPILLQETNHLIDEGLSAYDAYKKAAQHIISVFQTLTNTYMRNRIIDIEDATDRVLSAIVDSVYEQALQFPEPRILIIKKMKPSVLYNCRQPSVVGFISAEGAYDQHSGLIARTKGLPGLIVPDILKFIQQDDPILIDADEGVIYVHPSGETIRRILERKTVKP
jgi:phosphoenolpyruvate-protein kinase (PTS system EI component)